MVVTLNSARELPLPDLVFAESDEALLKVFRPSLPDLPDVEVDEAHREHVVGEEGELVLAVGVVGLEGVPQEGDVVLLAAGLEGDRQVVAEFGGFFRSSGLGDYGCVLLPNAGKGGLNLLLEAGDQFAIGGDEDLLGFDLGDDFLLRGEGWEGEA